MAAAPRAKLGRRVAVLEQYCEQLGRQLAAVQVAVQRGGGGAIAGHRRGSTGTPASVALSAVISSATTSENGEVVATRLSPVVADALSGDVRRQVVAAVDRRFMELEDLKDVGFQDVWRELRALHTAQGQATIDAQLALKEFELAQKSEVLATTKSTEEQLDAIQKGVADAIARHQEQTAAVVGVTNGRISDVVEELESKIAAVQRGDGSDLSGFAEAASRLQAVEGAAAENAAALQDHVRTTADAFRATQEAQAKLGGELRTTTGTAGAAKAQADTTAAALAALQEQVTALQATSSSTAGDTATQVAELRARVARQEELLTSLTMQAKATQQEHSAKLAQLATSAETSAVSLTTMSQQLAAHGLELGRVGEQVNRVEVTCTQTQRDLADTTQRLSGVADEVRQLATQLRAAADRASTNTATATSLTRRVTAHSNAVDTLRAEVAALARRAGTRLPSANGGGGSPGSTPSDRRVTALAQELDALRKQLTRAHEEARAGLQSVNDATTAAMARQNQSIMSHVDHTLQNWSDARVSALSAQLRAAQAGAMVAATDPDAPEAAWRSRSRDAGSTASGATGSGPGAATGAGDRSRSRDRRDRGPTSNAASNGSRSASDVDHRSRHRSSGSRAGSSVASGSTAGDAARDAAAAGRGGVPKHGARGGNAGSVGGGGGESAAAGTAASAHSRPPVRRGMSGGDGGDANRSMAASTVSGGGSINDGNPIGTGVARAPAVRSPHKDHQHVGAHFAPSIVSGTESSVVGREMLPPGERNQVVSSPLQDVTLKRTSLTSFLLRKAMEYGDKIAFMSAPSPSAVQSPDQGATNGSHEGGGDPKRSHQAKGFADLGALEDWLTYRDFSSHVRLVGAGLARSGFKKGDVMCIYAPNHVRYPVAFHAAVALGGVVVPCPVSESVTSLSELIVLAHPRVVVTTVDYYPAIASALQMADIRADVVFLDGDTSSLDDDGNSIGPPSLASLMSGGAVGFPAHLRVSPSRDPVMLLYVPRDDDRPGEEPRVVLITHKNICACMMSCLAAITHEGVSRVAALTGTRSVYPDAAVFQDKDLVVCGASFGTAAGVIWGLHLPLMMGASIVCTGFADSDAPAATSPLRLSEVVERAKAGVLVLSRPLPSLVESLNHVLRQVIVAMPLSDAEAEATQMHAAPPEGVSVCNITGPYEMLCCSHIMHLTPSLGRHPPDTLSRVVGVPLPNVRCRLVEPHARVPTSLQALGRHGRLCVRSQALARGLVTMSGVESLRLDAYKFFHANVDLAITSSGLFLLAPSPGVSSHRRRGSSSASAPRGAEAGSGRRQGGAESGAEGAGSGDDNTDGSGGGAEGRASQPRVPGRTGGGGGGGVGGNAAPPAPRQGYHGSSRGGGGAATSAGRAASGGGVGSAGGGVRAPERGGDAQARPSSKPVPVRSVNLYDDGPRRGGDFSDHDAAEGPGVYE